MQGEVASVGVTIRSVSVGAQLRHGREPILRAADDEMTGASTSQGR